MTAQTSYQELERRLTENEQRWRNFLDQNVAGIWRFEYRQPMPLNLAIDDQIEWMLDNGVLVECNDVLAKMYGFSNAGELVGKTYRELFQFNLPAAVETLHSWIEQRYQFDGHEIFQPTQINEYRCFLLVGFGTIENNLLTGSWGSQIDITERKKTEEALKESEKRYRTLIDTMNDGLVIINADGLVTYVNDRACEMWSRERKEVLSQPFTWFMDEDNQQIFRKEFKKRKQGDQAPYELTFTQKGGSRVPALISPRPLWDDRKRFAGSFAVITDISKLKLVEHSLRESEQRYKSLFQSANDAILLLKDWVIVDCNLKAVELFHTSHEKMIGLSPSDVSPETQPDGTLSNDDIDYRRNSLPNESSQFFEWRFLRKDGTQFDAEVSLNGFKIAGVPHALAIIRDITTRKAMIDTLTYQKTELDEKSRHLEKVNQALKNSLDQREIEKRAIEESMLLNLKRFVTPYLEELESCKIGADGKTYVSIIKTNINDMISKFSKSLFSKYMDFTPTEVRVADFIRNGQSTKEIANQLGLSPSSVKWHRKNIRAKLGLTNQKVNLQAHLNALNE